MAAVFWVALGHFTSVHAVLSESQEQNGLWKEESLENVV